VEPGQRNFYRLTSQGRALWARRRKLALPDDYRRILGLVDYSGHAAVIRGQLARYPDRVIDGWLAEFEALQLIERISAAAPKLSEIARKTAPPPLDEEERRHFGEDAAFADISLSRLGVYVAYERVANRPPSGKTPKETVALVVEDDPDQLALAVLRLTEAGYPVRTADCVKALFASLAERMPDAMFLDVMLPDGNGFEVLNTLRQHPTYALLPIIMLTAKVEPADVARGLALGAEGYVTKPYGRNTLEYVLRYVLKQEIPGNTSATLERQTRQSFPDSQQRRATAKA